MRPRSGSFRVPGIAGATTSFAPFMVSGALRIAAVFRRACARAPCEVRSGVAASPGVSPAVRYARPADAAGELHGARSEAFAAPPPCAAVAAVQSDLAAQPDVAAQPGAVARAG